MAQNMELKATSVGQHLAQHPYNKAVLLHAGIEVSGTKNVCTIPFKQLLSVQCKRGIVWGELIFELPKNEVVRLHGTEWRETQAFYRQLMRQWQCWDDEMSPIAAEVLHQQVNATELSLQHAGWFKRQTLEQIITDIHTALQALPLPVQRLPNFTSCAEAYRICLRWLTRGEQIRQEANQHYVQQMLAQPPASFMSVDNQPLNLVQCQALLCDESAVLVLAGAGSGKTSVLIARVGWLLFHQHVESQHILLLAFGQRAMEEMTLQLSERLKVKEIQATTFQALALHIIQKTGRQSPKISSLETDTQARHALLIRAWQKQCGERKAQEKGWRDWLNDELGGCLEEGPFWYDPAVNGCLAERLDCWLKLMRMYGGSQAGIVKQASEELRGVLQKRLRLMSPLLKAWKSALKEEGAIDFSDLIYQAINLVEKGHFLSPWQHILVDEFQDLSPLCTRLLLALREQRFLTSLFAVGDDWQAIYCFSGVPLSLTTMFEQNFGKSECYILDTTYRFNQRIGEITNQFIQQNPHQFKKPLHSLCKGEKKAIVALPEGQLELLLDKLSGFVKPDERVLLLARYHHLRPAILSLAGTRWPKLSLEFMTIYASKGQQADYVIVLGLTMGIDGFPAPSRGSVFEQGLLSTVEDFPDAAERRLLYVALTRARYQVWLLYDPVSPSIFVDQLSHLGISVQKKP